jgi:uncharacterized membrane protein
VSLAAENYISPTKTGKLDWAGWGATAFVAAFWLGLIIGAPLLKANGLAAAANWIYAPFSYLCHQISERSFHLSGEQLAVCARCFGVYAGLGIGILTYPLLLSVHSGEAPPRFILFLAPIPTTIDFALEFFGIWQNTHFSRFATGASLGVVCAFFVVPGIVEINRFLWLKNKKKTATTAVSPPEVSAQSDYSRPDLRI